VTKANIFLEAYGTVTKSKNPYLPSYELEVARELYLEPGGNLPLARAIQHVFEGGGDFRVLTEVDDLQGYVDAKYGLGSDLRTIITSLTTTATNTPPANTTTLPTEVPAKVASIPNPITTNPPATTSTPTPITTASTTNVTTTGSNTGAGMVAPSIEVPTILPKGRARRGKKGGEPVEVSLGPPAPPVPTRTLRTAAKRNIEQASLEDSGSSTSTRPKKTQHSE
jgi:hypothetical protein